MLHKALSRDMGFGTSAEDVMLQELVRSENLKRYLNMGAKRLVACAALRAFRQREQWQFTISVSSPSS